MAEAKQFDEHQKKLILAGLDLLMKSAKRAEHQMRTSNREAVANAIKDELSKMAETAQKAERVL